MGHKEVAKQYVEALGGLDNIKTIDNCITRLRLEIVNMDKVNEDRIIEIGSMGTIYVGKNKFHLIIGAQVVGIADEMHKLKGDDVVTKTSDKADDYKQIATQYIQVLGGVGNINRIDNCITRLRINLKDMNKVNEDALSNLDNKGVIHTSNTDLHIIIGLNVTSIAASMRQLYENA